MEVCHMYVNEDSTMKPTKTLFEKVGKKGRGTRNIMER
jgi:hypothetical protein